MSTANNTRPIVIGIDHGFGQIKTAHTCFKAGVTIHEKEPTFKSDLLIYEGRYYTIGEEHKTFLSDKALYQDYYILTLAAIARELRFRGMTSARVYLAAGLPLTWVSEQRETFKAYLLQKPSADFTFRGLAYHVDFLGGEVYSQGFSAVADKLSEFRGVTMLCDIGNGTIGTGSNTDPTAVPSLPPSTTTSPDRRDLPLTRSWKRGSGRRLFFRK